MKPLCTDTVTAYYGLVGADEPNAGVDRLDEAIHVDASGETRPDGITESEHRAIVETVNALLTDRARSPGSVAPATRRRSGAGLVVLANALIVVALAGAVAAYIAFVPRAAPDVNVLSGEVTTTEGAILEQVQQEAEQRLSEREAEIARIERELDALRRERTDDAAPSERERELIAELEGLNATTSERLGAIENNRERLGFLSDQLASLYQRVQTAIRVQDYDRARDLVRDAAALIDAPAVQTEPLLREASRSIDAANAVLADILPLAAEESGRLALLAAQIEEVELIVAQADARARAGELENAESLYRSAVRVFESTERATAQLLQFREQELAQEFSDERDSFRRTIAAVENQLRQSRSTVGSLEQQVASLERTRQSLQAQRVELESLLARANERTETVRARADQLGGTVDELQAEVSELESRLAALEAERNQTADETERRIHSLSETVASFRAAAERTTSDLADAAAAVRSQIGPSPTEDAASDVVELLGTRVLLRAVVDSPSVREEYPELYEDMEVYFEALSRARVEEGRSAAFAEASDAVTALAARMDIDLDVTAPATTATGYLERTVALVRAAVGRVGDGG